MWVEWEDGADLSRSQKKPGDYSPLTRDGDNQLGHVTLSDVDEDGEDSLADWQLDFDDTTSAHASESRAAEPSVLAEIIVGVVSHFIDVAVAEAKPHVNRWWNDQAVPAIKSTATSTRNKLAKTRKAGRHAREDELAALVEVVPEEHRVRMSTAEAQQRLVAALMARAFSDEQIGLLLSAQIGDADGSQAIESSMERFSPQEVEGHINLMLEANPSLLDEFVKLFRGDRIGDASGLPSRGGNPMKHFVDPMAESSGGYSRRGQTPF